MDKQLEAIRQEIRGLTYAIMALGIAVAGAQAPDQAEELGKMLAGAQHSADSQAKQAVDLS